MRAHRQRPALLLEPLERALVGPGTLLLVVEVADVLPRPPRQAQPHAPHLKHIAASHSCQLTKGGYAMRP